MQRGLRQGDPLSPYLFILGVDVFLQILKLTFEGNFVQKAGPWNLGIPCLKYADDTIMLLPSDLVFMKRVNILIYMFELLSGLFINFHKSSLYQLKPSDLDVSQISALLHCRVGTFPSPTWDSL